ncbi:hypothetical protein Hanom_Chr07g00675781 [Helianthus anomalus]
MIRITCSIDNLSAITKFFALSSSNKLGYFLHSSWSNNNLHTLQKRCCNATPGVPLNRFTKSTPISPKSFDKIPCS